MIKKYRKKPVVIDALLWTGKNLDEVYEFVGDSVGPIARRPDYDLIIKTLEGEHKADRGDYIIKGIHDEFYPCKPDIFEKTYEEVSE